MQFVLLSKKTDDNTKHIKELVERRTGIRIKKIVQTINETETDPQINSFMFTVEEKQKTEMTDRIMMKLQSWKGGSYKEKVVTLQQCNKKTMLIFVFYFILYPQITY